MLLNKEMISKKLRIRQFLRRRYAIGTQRYLWQTKPYTSLFLMFKKQLRTFICKLLFFILEMQKYTFFFNWKGFFCLLRKKILNPRRRPARPAIRPR